jgi:hypothetical protein
MEKMTELYKEYYKCSNPKCDSVYHLSNFENGKPLECRDCGVSSEPPKITVKNGLYSVKGN